MHLDRGLTTAAHIYHHVAPTLAPLATRHMGIERAQMAHDSVSRAFAGYGRVRERALQANRMVDALHHATKKRTPEPENGSAECSEALHRQPLPGVRDTE